MAWITLAAQDVSNAMAPGEQTAFPGDGPYMISLLTDLTQYIRGFVQTWGPNRAFMGPTGTIPDELKNAAVTLARFKLLASVPGTKLITKWREQEREDAIQTIKDTANGALRLQGYPDGTGVPEEQAAVGGQPLWYPYVEGKRDINDLGNGGFIWEGGSGWF